jgi:hypothetical protein
MQVDYHHQRIVKSIEASYLHSRTKFGNEDNIFLYKTIKTVKKQRHKN